MTLVYSPQARADLRDIKTYIRDTLLNPIAAENVTRKILKSCALLKENPKLGAELSEKTGKDTDMRYLIIGEYIAYYRIEDKAVRINRIKNERTTYMHIMIK